MSALSLEGSSILKLKTMPSRFGIVPDFPIVS